MGGDEVYSRLQSHLGIGNDETTEDGMVTLEHLECNAACDMAPVMMVNWEFFDQTTPQRACEVVDALRAGEEVTATRGARVVTWQQAERVLAGFPDGRADEGPTSGAHLAARAADRRPSVAGARPTRPTSADDDARGLLEGDAVTDMLTPVLTANWGDERAWKIGNYERRGGYSAPAHGAADGARRGRLGGQGLRAARSRRRGLPDRA